MILYFNVFPHNHPCTSFQVSLLLIELSSVIIIEVQGCRDRFMVTETETVHGNVHRNVHGDVHVNAHGNVHGHEHGHGQGQGQGQGKQETGNGDGLSRTVPLTLLKCGSCMSWPLSRMICPVYCGFKLQSPSSLAACIHTV